MDTTFGRQLQQRILTLLADNEAAIASLYHVYAVKCPNTRDLWNQLAKEEEQHAAVLRKLQLDLAAGDVIGAPEQFKLGVVRAMSERITAMTADCQERHVEEGAALANAVGLESAFLEGGIFVVADNDSPAYAKVARALACHTDIHRSRLEARSNAHAARRLAVMQGGPRAQNKVRHPHADCA